MSTYAQVSDLQNYTAMRLSTPDANLQGLLDRAENDVDKILPRTPFITDTVLGVSVSGSDSGQFQIQVTWRGVQYLSDVINWNDTGQNALAALQDMADTYGNFVPPGSWTIPDSRYYQQKWAFGPLPGTPVVVQARNSMGRQQLSQVNVVNKTLAGTNPRVTVQTIVGGGLRLNPYLIPADYADALRAAVCAQAEYRDQMGEQFFARAQYQSVQGPEFRTQGKLPLIGPKVMRELIGTDLVQRGARAKPGTVTGRQRAYSPTGTVPIPDDWMAV